jgi:GT2 family glycosyltransferase
VRGSDGTSFSERGRWSPRARASPTASAGRQSDMRVTAVVVNWNGGEALAPCLDALLAQDHEPLEIVVVDNASTDGSREVAERYEETGVRVVANPTNRGFSGGVNDGLEASDAPFVLVLNPDARPGPGYVSAALVPALADARVGSVQGKLLRTGLRGPDGEPVIDTTGHLAFRSRLFLNRGEGEPDRGQHDHPGEVFGVSGALALYRREMLDDVALDGHGTHGREVFDEDLFAYFDDVDLDWRARMRGWKAWYTPEAVGEHERGGAGPRRTPAVEQLNFQNRLLVVVKCDAAGPLARSLPGVAATTLLKAVWLLLSSPAAFVRAFGAVRLVPRMRRKRRAVYARATVASAEVVSAWFVRFDYPGWVRGWWRRVRAGDPAR